MGKPTSDVDRVQALLLWARQHRIVLGTVTVGTVSLTVVDLGMAAPTKRGARDREADLYNTFAPGRGADLAEAGLVPEDES